MLEPLGVEVELVELGLESVAKLVLPFWPQLQLGVEQQLFVERVPLAFLPANQAGVLEWTGWLLADLELAWHHISIPKNSYEEH